MEPESDKPGAGSEMKPKGEASEPVDARVAEEAPRPVPVAAKDVVVQKQLTNRKLSQVSRRELLKLAPVLALGAFAIPRFQESLAEEGAGL